MSGFVQPFKIIFGTYCYIYTFLPNDEDSEIFDDILGCSRRHLVLWDEFDEKVYLLSSVSGGFK